MLFSHVLIEGRLPHCCPSTLVTFVLKSVVHRSFVGLQVGQPVALVRAVCAVKQSLERVDTLHVIDHDPLGGSGFEVTMSAVKISRLKNSGTGSSSVIMINPSLTSFTVDVIYFHFLDFAYMFSCDVLFHCIFIICSVITP